MDLTFMRDRPITPTTIKQDDECTRYGILLEATGRDKYDPMHAQYGTAFGAGCAAYAMHPESEPEERLGRMCIEASKLWGFTQRLDTKTWPTMLKLMFAYAKYADTIRLSGLETETRIILNVVSGTGLIWKIGGAFDLLASTPDGIAVYDFKAVASEYYYSWESDPQILHYTLLQYIRWKLMPNTTVCPSGIGNYFVGVIPASNEFSFHVRSNHTGIWRTLDAHVSRCRELYITQQRVADFGIHSIPTSPSMCNGRRPCWFIPTCYDDEDFETVGREDTRVFNKIVKLSITEHELGVYVQELKELLRINEENAKSIDKAHAALMQGLSDSIDLSILEVEDNLNLLGDLDGN